MISTSAVLRGLKKLAALLLKMRESLAELSRQMMWKLAGYSISPPAPCLRDLRPYLFSSLHQMLPAASLPSLLSLSNSDMELEPSASLSLSLFSLFILYL
jgi:hypothetical protein